LNQQGRATKSQSDANGFPDKERFEGQVQEAIESNASALAGQVRSVDCDRTGERTADCVANLGGAGINFIVRCQSIDVEVTGCRLQMLKP